MMKPIESIHIIGMGALGILYGNMLTEALPKGAVRFIGDRARAAAYEKNGVYCNGKRCSFEMTEGGSQTPADLVVFAVKSTGLVQAAEQVRASVGEDTVILSLLNGISSEEILSGIFGEAHLVYTVAQGMDATKIGNRLTYANCGELRIGAPKADQKNPLPQGLQQRREENLRRVIELLERTGVPYTEEDDIIKRLWGKWMLNVGCNQTVMVEEGTYRIIQKGGRSRQQFIDAMREVIAVAGAEGVNLSEQDLENYLALTDTLDPDGMPSMRQDGLAGRPSEVDLFAGTVIEKAEKHGIAVPVNRTLYRRVKEIEAAY